MKIVELLSLLLSLLLLSILTPFLVFVEFYFLDTQMSELGFVEIVQELMVFVLVIKVMLEYKRKPKVLYLILALFFLVVLSRELDFLFNQVQHGSWIYPASIFSLIGFILIVKNRLTFLSQFALWKNTRGFAFFFLGCVVLFVFSRLFGTGRLWEVIMAEEYSRLIKTVVQEGLELFGYSIILYSIVVLSDKDDDPSLLLYSSSNSLSTLNC